MLHTALDRPDIGATLEALRSGGVFATLLFDSAEERAAALEAVLHEMAGDDTEILFVGNPLRSALTIERFLMQIIGPEVDLRIDRNPGDFAQLLGQRGEGRTRRLIVVQQPESINPETRDILGAMATHLTSFSAQFLFVGSPAFRPIRPIDLDIFEPEPVIPDAAAPPIDVVTTPSPLPTAHVPRRTGVLPVIFLLACIGAALAAGLASRAPIAAPDPPPVRFSFVPSSPSYRITTSVTNARLLRQQFDDFLTERASDLPPLSASQKDELFNEFLARPRTP